MAVKRTTKVREVTYYVTPASGTTPSQVLQVKDWTPASVSRPTEDDTCHEDANKQTSLGTPEFGAATIQVLFDPTDAVHLRLRSLALAASDPIYIVKCYGNGSAPPTITTLADGFVFPDSRSYLQVQGTVSNWRETGAIGQNTLWAFDFVPTGTTPVVPNDKTAIAFSNTAPNGTISVAYSSGTFAYTLVGDYGALAYSITSGALPTGLSLNATTGAITGTPSSAATFTYTVSVGDADGNTATLAESVVIAP